MSSKPKYSLRDLILYFLKLGTTGFGGPVALVGYMERDLVEERKWITEEEYKEGLALAQLAPGPLAAQLGIYIGFVHYRILGATLAGLAFIAPSFCMVVLLGIAYKLYGGLPWLQAVFYGVSATVIGIIAVNAYRLSVKSISALKWNAVSEKWLLWTFFVITAATTIISETEWVAVFIGAGLIYMLVKAPPKWIKKNPTASLVLVGTGFCQFETGTLGQLAFFFAKAGAFIFGSGFAIVPFLHSGVVDEHHWLDERTFLDAVAIAMITPGPVLITVGFIGYLIAGFPGACVAAGATFLPCYLFTIIPAPYFKRIAKNQSVKYFVDGITAAVMGALAGAVVVIGTRSITDIPTGIIAVCVMLVLFFTKKVPEPYLIVAGAGIGLLLKSMS